MTTLLSTAVSEFSQDLGDKHESTTTSAGDANGYYLVDNALLSKAPDWVIDGMEVRLPLGPTGISSAETRLVERAEGNRLYVKLPFSSQVLISVGYEVHRQFSYNDKVAALRDACKQEFPIVHERVRNRTIKGVANKYEYDITSLGIFNNKPHQILYTTDTIRDVWLTAHSYTAGDYVRPSTVDKFTGYVYKCTVSGTSGSTEPTWPTTIGVTVTDGVGALVWECQSEVDYSTKPQSSLHDWDETPDGHIIFPVEFDSTYTFTIVGIKPASFSGSPESVAIDSPHTLCLYARAALIAIYQRMHNVPSRDISVWQALYSQWYNDLLKREAMYSMKAPDGTLITQSGYYDAD